MEKAYVYWQHIQWNQFWYFWLLNQSEAEWRINASVSNGNIGEVGGLYPIRRLIIIWKYLSLLLIGIFSEILTKYDLIQEWNMFCAIFFLLLSYIISEI